MLIKHKNTLYNFQNVNCQIELVQYNSGNIVLLINEIETKNELEMFQIDKLWLTDFESCRSSLMHTISTAILSNSLIDLDSFILQPRAAQRLVE